MLVTTMKKQKRFVRCIIWDPRAEEKLSTVPASEGSFNGFHLSGAIHSRRRVIRWQSHRYPSCLFRDRDNCEAFQRSIELFAGAEIVCLWATLETIHRQSMGQPRR